jgi:hypothetical protein
MTHDDKPIEAVARKIYTDGLQGRSAYVGEYENGVVMLDGLFDLKKVAQAALRAVREWQGINAVQEIKPCPYVNGLIADNSDVSFMLKKYEQYSDFILFEAGEPVRCFRFFAQPPQEGK